MDTAKVMEVLRQIEFVGGKPGPERPGQCQVCGGWESDGGHRGDCKLEALLSEGRVMDQIEHILNEFPFDKVWQAMRAVGWKWGGPPGRYPTFTNLRRIAKKLLEWAAKAQSRTSMGGFEAIYANGTLELNFVLASASTEDANGNPLVLEATVSPCDMCMPGGDNPPCDESCEFYPHGKFLQRD